MAWYYSDQGAKTGPIDDDRFAELVSTGQVGPATLVWREGMASWQPYSAVNGGPSVMEGAAGFCTQCGTQQAFGDMVQFGDQWVCANCKDLYAQKLREGVSVAAMPGFRSYGGFWIRFVARLIDGILMGVVGAVIAFLLTTLSPVVPGTINWTLTATQYFVSIGLGVTYEAFLLSRYGATLGKMALGLRVIDASGAPVTTGQAVGRYFAQWVSSITLGIGYIMAAFDDQKRALHDRICNTRVVRT